MVKTKMLDSRFSHVSRIQELVDEQITRTKAELDEYLRERYMKSVKMLPKIDLKVGYPNFDPVAELICLVPTSPAFVSLKMVAEDLGYKNPSMMANVVQAAKKRYPCVKTFNSGGRLGRSITLVPPEAERVTEIAEKYYRAMYESDSGS